MDLYCKFCREPWELDSIHDYIDDEKSEEGKLLRAQVIIAAGGPKNADPDRISREFNAMYESKLYVTVYRDFLERGCPALGGKHNASYDPKTSKADPVFEALADVMGDDSDGFAAALEDLRLF